ncbi:MAG: 23S rRNA (uracil(1939)-C(5))-methyltransferase RlmD [Cellvibrionaceae bacterium]|nr:23S rRNA (uracil(1939)-C(5))-methyltransferase RlmD [Cellvibrionaceae bacterium]
MAPSEHPSQPPCAHFGQCGGCQLQPLDYPSQLEHKRQALWQNLAKLLRPRAQKAKPKLGQRAQPKAKSLLHSPIKGPEQIECLASQPWGYRRRARLGVSQCGQLGFRRGQSQTILAIDQCPVLSPACAGLLAQLNQFMAAHKGFAWARYLGHVELLDIGPSPLAILRQTRDWPQQLAQGLVQLAQDQGFRLAAQSQKGGTLQSWQGELDSYYELPPWQLGFAPGGFIQVNAGVNKAMVAQALEWLAPAPGQTLLDLFCGVGNFSLPLAATGARVVGLELAEPLLAQARANAAAAGLEIEFICADLEAEPGRWWRGLKAAGVGAVLLDPPRAGAKGMMKRLAELSCSRILYVSCNQSTLMRDLAELGGVGYRLTRLAMMDMFPQTDHLECMALLER